MKINIHIERLVLDGLPVTHAQGPLLQQAVEAELGQLLGEGGLSSALAGGGAMPHVPVSQIQLRRGDDSGAIGRQIARSVYGGIGGDNGSRTGK